MECRASREALLERLAGGALQICGGDWCAVGLLDPSTSALRVREWVAAPRPVGADLAPASIEPALERALVEDRAFPSRERGGPFARPGSPVGDTRASLTVPVRVEGRLEALLCVGWRSPHAFGDRERSSLGWLADQAGTVLAHVGLLEDAGRENARLFAESRRQRRTAEALALVARATSRPFDIRALGQQIVDTVLLLMGCGRVTLFAQDAASGDFRLVAVARRAELAASADVTAPEPGPVEALAVLDRRLVSTPDFLAEPGMAEAIEPVPPPETAIRAMLAVPLFHGSAAIGILSVADRAGRLFGDDEVNVFLAAADHAAVALQSAFLHAQVTEAARVQERMEIANTLHDTLSQLAFSVGLKLDWCLHRMSAGSQLRPKLEEIRRDTGLMMAQIRRLIGHLAVEGAGAATGARRFEGLADEFRELTGTRVDFALAGDPARLSPAVQDALYKTLQEALVNIAKHARATRAEVRIEVGPEQAVIAVSDDGVGLPVGEAAGRPGHQGLRQMRERIEILGGRLEVVGEPGVGVRVRGVLPRG
jgi:signal transduction histidine kinase